MITDRNKLNFVTIQWLRLLAVIVLVIETTLAHNVALTTQQQQQQQQQQSLLELELHLAQQPQFSRQQPDNNSKTLPGITVLNFSPRMDNNEWRPVGRGDPLKNDPTFDYSPPALERVRYWADTERDKEKTDDPNASVIDAKLKKANPGKNEILLLGLSDRDRDRDREHERERLRGTFQHHPPSHTFKDEIPILQPKYTSIRRSYYAHQLPTHLMPPPPMQTIMPANYNVMKTKVGEHTHNMLNFMTSAPITVMTAQPYYTTHTATTATWLPYKASDSTYDAHNPETGFNYLTYTKPKLESTPGTIHRGDLYSPNAIGRPSNYNKINSMTVSRKPWIHDLLQKEFIKPAKLQNHTTFNNFSMETVKPPPEVQPFKPVVTLINSLPHNTTIKPVSFITTTTTTTTTTTPTTITTTMFSIPSNTTLTISSNSNKQQLHSQVNIATPTLPPPTTLKSTTKMIHHHLSTTTPKSIPYINNNNNNMIQRPTLMPPLPTTTTESQFKPNLKNAMYLIIEGHSKVKTYGKDELDPYKPKIVPIIPKREPIVRVGNAQEERGTAETFQVKHLHTSTTATNPVVLRSENFILTTTTTTTPKPKPLTTKIRTPLPVTETPKTTKIDTSPLPATIPTTAVKTPTTKTNTPPTPTINLLTKSTKTILIPENVLTTTTTATTIKPKLNIKPFPTIADILKTPQFVSKNIDSTNKNLANHQIQSNTLDSSNIPPANATTAAQDFFSILDFSLDSLLREDDDDDNEYNKKFKTTKLKPIYDMDNNANNVTNNSTKLYSISNDSKRAPTTITTTEIIPHKMQQIFDYKNMPESRLNPADIISYDDDDDDDDEQLENLSSLTNEESKDYGDGVDDGTNRLIKRIDELMESDENVSWEDLEQETLDSTRLRT